MPTFFRAAEHLWIPPERTRSAGPDHPPKRQGKLQLNHVSCRQTSLPSDFFVADSRWKQTSLQSTVQDERLSNGLSWRQTETTCSKDRCFWHQASAQTTFPFLLTSASNNGVDHIPNWDSCELYRHRKFKVNTRLTCLKLWDSLEMNCRSHNNPLAQFQFIYKAKVLRLIPLYFGTLSLIFPSLSWSTWLIMPVLWVPVAVTQQWETLPMLIDVLMAV